jgi:hypothetical protein
MIPEKKLGSWPPIKGRYHQLDAALAIRASIYDIAQEDDPRLLLPFLSIGFNEAKQRLE